jgi:hypothetical protein
MPGTVKLQAPSGSGLGGLITGLPSGSAYQTDALGQVTVQLQDAPVLLAQGYLGVTALPPENFRNLLDGSDATTNPWQRGTSFSAIAATVVYTADRWFMQGAVNTSGTMAQTANSSIPTFGSTFVWGRAAGATASNTLYLGQAIETANSIRTQSETITLSLWASANTGWLSPATGANALGVQVSWGAGTNQSASSLIAGTWTNQANVISATQALTNTLTRYFFTGVVPASATQIGVLFSYAPAASALANETINMMAIQLEVDKAGTGAPTNFEKLRQVDINNECYRYYYQFSEPATGAVLGAGYTGPANSAVITLPLPVPMRAVPAVSCTVGGFGVGVGGVYTVVTSFAANTTQTLNAVTVHGLVSATSGNAAFLIGSGGVGVITASADL